MNQGYNNNRARNGFYQRNNGQYNHGNGNNGYNTPNGLTRPQKRGRKAISPNLYGQNKRLNQNNNNNNRQNVNNIVRQEVARQIANPNNMQEVPITKCYVFCGQFSDVLENEADIKTVKSILIDGHKISFINSNNQHIPAQALEADFSCTTLVIRLNSGLFGINGNVEPDLSGDVFLAIMGNLDRSIDPLVNEFRPKRTIVLLNEYSNVSAVLSCYAVSKKYRVIMLDDSNQTKLADIQSKPDRIEAFASRIRTAVTSFKQNDANHVITPDRQVMV